jgi:Asp-tRNA(Asn)/Glu-tRNA(Gln) amidotransferase A subunit family amidase
MTYLVYDNTNARSIDDPKIYHGAPVGVQIVARKFEEEKALAIAKIIYAALTDKKERVAKL